MVLMPILLIIFEQAFADGLDIFFRQWRNRVEFLCRSPVCRGRQKPYGFSALAPKPAAVRRASLRGFRRFLQSALSAPVCPRRYQMVVYADTAR